MKLSDIMSAAGLAVYAEIALLIFFGVFVAVSVWVLTKRNTEKWEKARHLPLDDRQPYEHPNTPNSESLK